jgi:hypothetical protein
MIMVEQDSLKEARKKGKDTEQYYQELHEESQRIPDSEPPFWEAFECGLCNIKGRGCPNPEKAK